MSKGLALTLSWEARSNQIAGLRAIVQSDCRTACNHAIGLYHGVFVDCGTACNRAIRLQYCVQLCRAFGFLGLVKIGLIIQK